MDFSTETTRWANGVSSGVDWQFLGGLAEISYCYNESNRPAAALFATVDDISRLLELEACLFGRVLSFTLYRP